ncbi:Vegetative incompatibility HET-E-1-like protein [Cladobotryum mycophilum]|uniref:Vegetative incompatibility HET-E-1-like protein n=1 Tax=Cladobotryum mycophilum TaxID=491253 RepID=A0ABR0SZ98_9HYPO
MLLKELQSVVHAIEGAQIQSFLHDAERFVLYFRSIINIAPLRLYNSALVFSPLRSIVRQKFSIQADFQSWIANPPLVDSSWSSCLQTFEGYDDSISYLTFLENGRLVSAFHPRDKVGSIRIWDLASGICLQTLNINMEQKLYTVAFPAKGKLAFAQEQRIEVITAGMDHGWTALTFLENDKLFAVVVGDDGIIKTWSQEDHQRMQINARSIVGQGNYALSADGQWFAWSSSDSNTLKLLDLKSNTSQSLRNFDPHNGHGASRLAFSRDSKRLVLGTDNGQVHIWDVPSGRCLQTLVNHVWMAHFVFSPNNDIIAVANFGDFVINIWNWRKKKRLRTLFANGSVHSLAFSPNGTWLASGSYHGEIQIWDMNMLDTQMPKIHSDVLDSVAFRLEGKRLVSGSYPGGDWKIWDTTTGACLWEQSGAVLGDQQEKIAEALKLPRNIKMQNLEVFFHPTGAELSRGVYAMAMSADYRRYAAKSGKTLTIVDIYAGIVCAFETQESTPLPSVSPSSDGVQVAEADGPIINHWNLSTGKELKLRFSYDTVQSMAFSEDGSRLVALCGSDGNIWDTTSGKCLRQFKSASPNRNLHPSFINMEFSPDAPSSLIQSSEACLKDYHIAPYDEWIMKGAEKFLWLPPDFRLSRTVIWG